MRYTKESYKKVVAGSKKSAAIQIERKKRRIVKYDKSPKVCELCKKKLEYEKRNNRFCGRKCSAINFNRSKIITRLCVNCNEPIKDSTPKSKYCTHDCQRKYEWEKIKKEIVRTGNANPNNGKVAPKIPKRYLLETRGQKCEICGRTNWNGKPIPIVLDHISGHAEDWKLTNLRLICPNCDAQTDTYKNKNRGNGRHARRERYKGGKSY